MVRTASCCCGTATIEVEGDPALHAVCHCDNCKRRTGSAFGISAYFTDAQLRGTSGETEIYAIGGDKSQQRHFCKICGTTLFWKASWFARMTGIAGGCFTDPPLPEPTLTVSNGGRCPWLTLPEDWATTLDRTGGG